VGDTTMGDGYNQFVQYPLQRSVIPEWKAANPVRTLRLRKEASDFVLDWQSVSGATTYRVHASAFPDAPRSSWTALSEVSALTYRDPGAGDPGPNRFYSVSAVNAAGQEVW
jgi:hypothetical protein